MDRITGGMLESFIKEFSLHDYSESELFEQFAAYSVVKRHHPATFDPSVLITGNAYGIDAIAILVNGTLIGDVDDFFDLIERSSSFDVQFIFVQAKTSARFDSAQLGNLGHAVLDFFSPAPSIPPTDRVREAALLMDEIYKHPTKFRGGNNPECRLYYVTTGRLVEDPVLESRRRQVINDLQGLGAFGAIDFQLVGADAIHKLYRQTHNSLSREFTFVRRSVVPGASGVVQSYLGLIPATELMNLLSGDDGQIVEGLFHANVRDWEGYNEINREIQKTLASDEGRANFALLNNGITITARTLHPIADRFTIEDFQIVNGCQTCSVLHDNQDLLDHTVFVPLRLIATQDEDLISAITKATNRQTHVKEEQFFALTEFPKKLEMFFEHFPEPQRLYYERRANQYNRKDIPKIRIATQANMIRSFAAMFLEEPHGVTKSKKSLTERLGKEICGQDHKHDPYYVALFALYLLDRLFPKKVHTKYRPARFHILLAARLLANPSTLPPVNSREMEKYCKVITDKLWEPVEAERLLLRAVEAVGAIAQDDFQRDNIRTALFTKRLKEHCQSLAESDAH